MIWCGSTEYYHNQQTAFLRKGGEKRGGNERRVGVPNDRLLDTRRQKSCFYEQRGSHQFLTLPSSKFSVYYDPTPDVFRVSDERFGRVSNQ